MEVEAAQFAFGESDNVVLDIGIFKSFLTARYRCIYKIINSYEYKGVEMVVPVTSMTLETTEGKGIKRKALAVQKKDNLGGENANQKLGAQNSRFVPKRKRDNIDDNGRGNELIFEETEEDFIKYMDKYDQSIDAHQTRFFIFFGDQKGTMHILNILQILQKRDIQPLKEEKKSGEFALRRKDLTNASKNVENVLTSAERRSEAKPLEIVALNTILINKWEAHSAQINKLTKISEPLSIVTCSFDKYVKIWSFEGDQYAFLNLVRFDKNKDHWHFPYDIIKQKIEEIEVVCDFAKVIEKEEDLSEPRKEQIKIRYLTNKFFQQNTWKSFDDFLKIKYFNPQEQKEIKKPKKNNQLM